MDGERGRRRGGRAALGQIDHGRRARGRDRPARRRRARVRRRAPRRGGGGRWRFGRPTVATTVSGVGPGGRPKAVASRRRLDRRSDARGPVTGTGVLEQAADRPGQLGSGDHDRRVLRAPACPADGPGRGSRRRRRRAAGAGPRTTPVGSASESASSGGWRPEPSAPATSTASRVPRSGTARAANSPALSAWSSASLVNTHGVPTDDHRPGADRLHDHHCARPSRRRSTTCGPGRDVEAGDRAERLEGAQVGETGGHARRRSPPRSTGCESSNGSAAGRSCAIGRELGVGVGHDQRVPGRRPTP